MKVILTGTTGQIGLAVLKRCIAVSEITHIFTLTRRPLPEQFISNDKVTNILHDDFSSYPESLLAKLDGASICIWSLGVTPRKAKGDAQLFKQADVDFTINAAQAFLKYLQPKLSGQKFRFVYVSGLGAERDHLRSLWVMRDARRSKGAAEQKLAEMAAKDKNAFELFCARPGQVLGQDTWLPDLVVWTLYAVREDQLAYTLVEVALHGHTSEILYARDLPTIGAELLRKG